MADAKRNDEKSKALSRRGCLNRHPEKVQDELFRRADFFDAKDLVQVKYEMLRRVRLEGQSVSRAAAEFGFSRPTFYQAQETFTDSGLAGLIPSKPGPKGAHKFNDEVVDYVLERQAQDPSLRPEDLVGLVQQRFGFKAHPRSLERALERRKKNS